MNYIRKFYRSNDGNIAVITALTISLMLLCVGIVIDYSRQVSSDIKSQDLADAMVLAAANELANGGNKKEANEIAIQVFEDNSANHVNTNFDKPIVKIKKDQDRYRLHVDLLGEVQPVFMHIFGRKKLGVAASAESEVEINTVEIVLVVDVSWSMQAGKIDPMKAALKEFIDAYYPRSNFKNTRRVSIIPYADTVHFGNSYEHWLERDAPPSPVTMYQADGTPYTIYRHLNPTNSQLYVGCFQHEPNSQIQTGRASSIRPGNFLSFIQSYAAGAPRCPSANSQMRLFQDNPQQLKKYIDGLELGFGTSTDVGAVWGWRALSPSWRGQFNNHAYPKPFAKDTIKHLIILTDGKTNRSDLVGDGKSVTMVNREPATSNLSALCESIKRENQIHLTTVAYGFTEKEAEMRPILQKCVSKKGKFYQASTSDVGSVLSSIAKSVNVIRLTS